MREIAGKKIISLIFTLFPKRFLFRGKKISRLPLASLSLLVQKIERIRTQKHSLSVIQLRKKAVSIISLMQKKKNTNFQSISYQ